jgi:hypothetical protein
MVMSVAGGLKTTISRVFNMARISGKDIKPNSRYVADASCGKDLFHLREIESGQQSTTNDWSVKINEKLAHRIRCIDKTKSFRENVEALLERALTHQPR